MTSKQRILLIGRITLWGAMAFVASYSGYRVVRFAKEQEHVSALKMIHLAFIEYHDSHQVLPIKTQDDLWAGGWRSHIIDSPCMMGAYGSRDAFRRVLERYALLMPSDSPWLDGKTQSWGDLRDRYGESVIVVQLPKDLLGLHCSALILDARNQSLQLKDGTELSLTILRDLIGVRRDGSVCSIPRDADAALILRTLQRDDRYLGRQK